MWHDRCSTNVLLTCRTWRRRALRFPVNTSQLLLAAPSERSLGQRRVAGAENRVGAEVDGSLFFHRLRDVDLGEDPETSSFSAAFVWSRASSKVRLVFVPNP